MRKSSKDYVIHYHFDDNGYELEKILEMNFKEYIRELEIIWNDLQKHKVLV